MHLPGFFFVGEHCSKTIFLAETVVFLNMFSLYLAETNAKLRVRSILADHGVVSGGTTSIYLFYD